jgi:molybdopterin-containing oxidoreductase family iron-sulfur binding subunit
MKHNDPRRYSRREALKLGIFGSFAGLFSLFSVSPLLSRMDLFKLPIRKMSKEQIEQLRNKIAGSITKKWPGVSVSVTALKADSKVKYAMAVDLSRCIGCRECVAACLKENNQSSSGGMEYIRVLELEKGEKNPIYGNHVYRDEEVPREDRDYMPVQCQQCENPSCVQACPVGATWQEEDGITVVDYDWCIGCRYCQNACPYYARRFNYSAPRLESSRLNPEVDILSNRPRESGVVEKCTFCLHKVRAGELPACVQACPTGARIFGDMNEKDGVIQSVLSQSNTFKLKSNLKNNPRFLYFYSNSEETS